MSLDPTQRMMQANQALANGDFAMAEAICQEVLGQGQDHAGAIHLLGIVCARQGQREAAIQHFRRSLELDSENPAIMVSLAAVLLEAGSIEEAISVAQRCVELHPDSVEALASLGHAFFVARRSADARKAFSRAIEHAPSNAELYRGLGLAWQLEGYRNQAEDAFRRACELNPHSAVNHLSLGQLLVERDDFDGAGEACKKALEVDPENMPAFSILVRVYAELGDTEAAENCFKKLCEVYPNSVASYGLWLQSLGRVDDAIAAFERAIEVAPVQGVAYHGLVNSRKTTEANREIVHSMRRIAAECELTPYESVHLLYALGKALDDLGDYEQAMHYYDLGNGVMRKLRRLVTTEDIIRTYDKLIEVFTPEFVEAHKGVGVDDETPILIVGMMRSGTSLTEQIVCAHPDVGGAGELHFWVDRGSFVFHPDFKGLSKDQALEIATAYNEILRKKSPSGKRVTEKMPANYMMLGLIRIVYPKAKIIHVRRNPIDTAMSMYMTVMYPPVGFINDRSTIVTAFEQYLRIMAHWRKVLPSDNFLEVNYEDLTANQEEQVRRIIEFCGLPWDDACLHHERNEHRVSTPSLWGARKPIYRTSVERWRRYEPYLGEFRKLLEMKHPPIVERGA